MKKEVPEGLCCYVLHMFAADIVCPDLGAEIVREPKCRKFGVELGWTVSGRVLKCSECLKGGKR